MKKLLREEAENDAKAQEFFKTHNLNLMTKIEETKKEESMNRKLLKVLTIMEGWNNQDQHQGGQRQRGQR